MRYENPTTHNGFVITAYASELPEGCRKAAGRAS